MNPIDARAIHVHEGRQRVKSVLLIFAMFERIWRFEQAKTDSNMPVKIGKSDIE